MKPLALARRLPLGLGALVAALGLALPAAAQVTPYGSGINPPGSLVVTSGVPQVGQSFNAGVSNTATSSAPAALAFLSIAVNPDPAFPAGTVLPGLGLSSPGAPGELLISLISPDPFANFGPVSWAGGTTPPAGFPIAVPLQPGLSGVTFYLQGALVDLTAGPSLGLTNGLAVKLAPPGTTGPVPCVSQFPGMAIIPQGTFQMGSNAASGPPYFGELDGAKPAHQVTLSYCFWIGRHEVTQAEYQALMGSNPSFFIGPDKPVENVAWSDAQAYCAAMTVQYSSLGALPAGYHFRLPTEAEWEYACRAGSPTEFHYGDSLTCGTARFYYSWHSSSECLGWLSGTVPVGSYLPNAWGLYDMHGNVWEWCLDSYAAYSVSAVTDPFVTDPFITSFSNRVIRGGSFYYDSPFCRSAWRNFTNLSGIGILSLGFRVVLAPVLVP